MALDTREKWNREQRVPVEEFYCWFAFLFDCDFLVDLDGGEGPVGEGIVCVHLWRESKVVVKVIHGVSVPRRVGSAVNATTTNLSGARPT